MNTEAVMEPEACGLSDQTMIELPFGLLGFERVKKYVLLARPEEAPFMWMQMLDNARRSFLIVSPFVVVPDYQPDIPADDVAFLGLTEPSDALVYNICTVRATTRATINLKGPLVFNRHTMVGKQVIPNNATRLALDYPLPVV